MKKKIDENIHLNDVIILAEPLIVHLRLAELSGQLLESVLDRDHDGHRVILQTVPVHTDVLNQRMRLQLGFNLT